MEGDPTAQAPVAEAPEAQAPPSEESASQAQPEDISPASRDLMNTLIRGGILKEPASASKPDSDESDDADADASDGVSAPTGDVKPSDQPKTGRRGAAARIAELEAENARLQKAYEEANPPPPDATAEARAKAIEIENRFRKLLLKPDTDQDWDADDWKWLQDEKARRNVAPELRQHYDTVLEADRAALEQDAIRRESAFLAGQAQQILTLAELPGIDAEAFRKSPYAVQGRMLYDALPPAVQADLKELKELREEVRQLKREGLGGIRTAPNGGRSSPGRTYSENDLMNTLIRGGRV